MEYFDKILKIKEKLLNFIKEFFRNTEIKFFTEPENAKSNYWLNVIQFQIEKRETHSLNLQMLMVL